MYFVFCVLVVLCQFSSGLFSPIENDEIPSVEPEALDKLLENGEYEEFARLLRIDDVNLVIPKEGNQLVNPMYNEGIPLGDILLTKQQDEESRQGLNFQRYGGNKWPNGQIPYAISSSGFSSQQRQTIQNAINVFNSRNTGTRFTPRRNERDYVMMFSGQGCYSHLGKTGNQQPLSLQSNGCVSSSTVQHEMVHAVGFTHEQNRPDRDDYVRVLWQNIPERWRSQYQKGSTRDYVMPENYDYYSLMHYGMQAPETRQRAFDILKPGIDERRIGRGSGLTQMDVSKIRKLYA